jgi:AbiV family abortive infection protein
MKECFFSALNFWQSANYVADKGGLHIAVGLCILGIEELGKYVLLSEAAANAHSGSEVLTIPIQVFRNHKTKSEKGQSLFKKWGVDLSLAEILLTKETREQLWYVTWDDETQEFKKDLRVLTTGAIIKTEVLRELMRLGLSKMQAEASQAA